MNINPATMSLLMQAQQNPRSARAALSQMVAELADEDPQMTVLSQYLALQSAQDAPDDALTDDENTDLSQHNDGIGTEDLESLREELLIIQTQLNEQSQIAAELVDRNNELAAALGACAQCWGEDCECAVCFGQGIPGSRTPDGECFRYYLSPFLRQMKTWIRSHSHAPGANGNHHR